MSELKYWRASNETKQILKKIQDEMRIIKDELNNGTLLQLPNNERLANRYSCSIGMLFGLGIAENLLKEEE